MTSEHDQLAALLSNKEKCEINGFSYTVGLVGQNRIALIQCGIGKVNASVGTSELIRNFKPDCIISTGVAGGIDTCLNVMDIVVATHACYHDVWCGEGNEKGQIQGMPLKFATSEKLVAAAMKITSATIKQGLICTGDQFITSRSELAVIKGNFPDCLAVDMESAAIAHTCHIYGIPFVSFRIISDTPGVENHQQQYENFWGEMANRSFGATLEFLKNI